MTNPQTHAGRDAHPSATHGESRSIARVDEDGLDGILGEARDARVANAHDPWTDTRIGIPPVPSGDAMTAEQRGRRDVTRTERDRVRSSTRNALVPAAIFAVVLAVAASGVAVREWRAAVLREQRAAVLREQRAVVVPSATAVPAPSTRERDVAQSERIPLVAPAALRAPVAFAFNSAKPRVTSRRELVDFVGDVKRCDGRVVVTGHTCALGPEEANAEVGRFRALAVADLLAAKGIERARLVVKSAGSSEPISGRAARGRVNRRVTVTCVTTS